MSGVSALLAKALSPWVEERWKEAGQGRGLLEKCESSCRNTWIRVNVVSNELVSSYELVYEPVTK